MVGFEIDQDRVSVPRLQRQQAPADLDDPRAERLSVELLRAVDVVHRESRIERRGLEHRHLLRSLAPDSTSPRAMQSRNATCEHAGMADTEPGDDTRRTYLAQERTLLAW